MRPYDFEDGYQHFRETIKIEAILFSGSLVTVHKRIHGITSQNMTFDVVTAVRISTLISSSLFSFLI